MWRWIPKSFGGTAANSTSDIDDTADMLGLRERPPDTVAPPGAHDVHVWAIDLRRGAEAADRALLSGDERARADRFRSPGLRERFTAGRAALRRLLGAYTRRPPARIEFAYNARGKPSLVTKEPIAFNLSHSGDLAVCAIAHAIEIGADVEEVRPVTHAEAIASRFFTPSETAAILARADGDERSLAFLRAWTRKEACVKASGDGLGESLANIEVPVDDQAWCDIVDRRNGRGYRVHAYAIASSHVGATALPPGEWRIDGFSLP